MSPVGVFLDTFAIRILDASIIRPFCCLGLPSEVDNLHILLEFLYLFFADGYCRGFFPSEGDPFVDGRDGVFASHTIVGIVSHESGLFPSGMMSGVVASDDALHFPPFDVMQELPTGETNLAHEHLIDFVSGCQFFAPVSSCCSPADGSGLFFFSISGILKNSAASESMTL